MMNGQDNTATSPPTEIGPVSPGQRILVLDVLRGFALLGILIVNIQYFAMPEAVYFIPTLHGDMNGANLWVWILTQIFGEQKFMTIFSMLYGAGIVLITSKLEKQGKSSLGLHYRRSFWLLIIGLIHAYLIWSGDILVIYALCAFIVYWFRRMRPRRLLILGLIVIGFGSAITLAGYVSLQFAPQEALDQFTAMSLPDADVLAAEISAYQGSWLDQMAPRVPAAWEMETTMFLMWGLWRAGGLMLIGMALYKWGVLTGTRSRRFYVWLTVIGLGVGLPVVTYGVIQNVARDWEVLYSRLGPGVQTNYWASVLVSLGYVGGVTLFVMADRLQPLQRSLAAIGRTALSNYILQSLIATFIFYGHGLGMFGTLERTSQAMVVVLIWIIQLIVSPIWLRYFRFGPLEWLWRTLTYWSIQPMRVNEPSTQST